MAYRVVPDEYGRPPNVSFDAPEDFLRYMEDIEAGKFAHLGITEVDPGSRRQAEEIRKNPKGWEMSGGHPKKKDDWLARNLPWIGPAVVGAGALGFGLAGGSKTAAAVGAKTGTGVATAGGMNQAIPPAISSLGGVGGGTGMIPPPGGAGGGFWRTLGNGARRVVGGNDGGFNPWQTAALAALAGLPALIAAKNSGMSDEEKAIYAQLRQDMEDRRQDRGPERALRDTQLRRINYQNPLYQAVSQLAMNRLPTNVQQPFGEF